MQQSLQSHVSLLGFGPGIVIWTFKALTAQCPPFPESTCSNLVSVTCKPKDSTHGNKIKDGICWSILESQEEFQVDGRGLGLETGFVSIKMLSCFHLARYLGFIISHMRWSSLWLKEQNTWPSESHWLITLAQDTDASSSTLHKCPKATVTKCNMLGSSEHQKSTVSQLWRLEV